MCGRDLALSVLVAEAFRYVVGGGGFEPPSFRLSTRLLIQTVELPAHMLILLLMLSKVHYHFFQDVYVVLEQSHSDVTIVAEKLSNLASLVIMIDMP